MKPLFFRLPVKEYCARLFSHWYIAVLSSSTTQICDAFALANEERARFRLYPLLLR